MNDFKERWEANIALFNSVRGSLTIEEAQVITTLQADKSPFFNALNYGHKLGLFFQDPEKPKQILARSLADIILKLAS